MTSFFDTVDPEIAAELEQLSRLMYELRENHHAVLTPYRADDATALLARIEAGEKITLDDHNTLLQAAQTSCKTPGEEPDRAND